ncbi:MAG: hypothetical protein R3337_00275 [Gammaproteobacteria bacterium]|nr:hypothetical protein [Gammaproteobacteria bacterium]
MLALPDHLRGVVHRYYLPPTTPPGVGPGGDSWSLWLLDQETGSLCIVSDYGNWTHCWGRSGCVHADFRREFLRLGGHYIGKKLTHGMTRVFQAEETVKLVRETILELRRDGTWDSDFARETWDDIGEVEDSDGFSRFLDSDGRRWNAFWEYACYDISERRWLTHLMTVSLPRVRRAIESELAAETEAAQ